MCAMLQSSVEPVVHDGGMRTKATPEIVAVERLSDGIVVKFADGSCAFFSTHLLYATAPRAEMKDEKATAW